jgi:hypothetical protein
VLGSNTAARLIVDAEKLTMMRDTAAKYLAVAALHGLSCLAPAGAAMREYETYYNPKRLNSTVYESRNYQHAATVAVYKGKVFVAWNGNNYSSKEGDPGQVIMLRTSDDGGSHWSDTRIPFVKDYRALDELQGKAVDAQPGNADDDHKIRLASARQWQPSLVVFRDKLLMFWSQDRSTPGSSLIMSALENGGEQWRSHELHFKPDGTPHMLAVVNGGKDLFKVSNPSYISVERAVRAQLPMITGAEALPATASIRGLSRASLDQAGSGDVPAGAATVNFVPAPHHAAVLRDRSGEPMLAVAVILQQASGDWANSAIKVPAVLTTRDLTNWQMSIMPLRKGGGDFLGDPRGDVGLLSAWEPTIVQDIDGNLEMLFRLNLPPKQDSGGDPGSQGFRAAISKGRFTPSGAIQWELPRPVDYDVPVTRPSAIYLPEARRWVLVQNHSVQGAGYDSSGAPSFRSEKYDPWARQNITVFFSSRGKDDFVAGLSVSESAEEPGVEIVHYPYVAVDGGDLLIVYSTHRRIPACFQNKGSAMPVEICHDSIRLSRIRDLPDASKLYVYPNHFAHHYKYGKAKAQEKTYRVSGRTLTLINQGSAGIETPGDRGCLSLKFRLDGNIQGNRARPVISFGRTPDRTSSVGLSIERAASSAYRLMAGHEPVPGNIRVGEWTSKNVCYDYRAKTLSVDGAEYRLGNAMSERSYLGETGLGRLEADYPDISFDVGGMRLKYESQKAR